MAVVGALVAGGGGVAGEAAFDEDGSPPAGQPASPLNPPARSTDAPFGVPDPADAAKPNTDKAQPEARGKSRRTAAEREDARQKAKKNLARGGSNRPLSAGNSTKARAVKPVKNRAPLGLPNTRRGAARAPVRVAPRMPARARGKAAPPERVERARGRQMPSPPIEAPLP